MPDMRADIQNRVGWVKQPCDDSADLRLPNVKIIDVAPNSVHLVDNHMETVPRLNLNRPDQPQLPEEQEVRLDIGGASMTRRKGIE
jgi:hypothetical protein